MPSACISSAWLVAIPPLAALVVLHVATTSTWLVGQGQGRETPLLGTGSVVSVAVLGGWLLPGAAVVGPIVVAVAVCRTRRDGILLLHAPVLAFPFVGLLVERPVWSLFVFPVAMPFLLETTVDAAVDWRRRLRMGAGVDRSSSPATTVPTMQT